MKGWKENMLEYIKSESGRPISLDPGVTHWIKDSSITPILTGTANTGTLFVPIYAEKGIEGVVKYFSGSSGYANLINEYGEPDLFRFGLPYTAAVQHMTLGGNVVTILCKPDDAKKAGFISYIRIKRRVPKLDEAGNVVMDSTGLSPEMVTPKKVLGWVTNNVTGVGFKYDPYANAKNPPKELVYEVQEDGRTVKKVPFLKEIDTVNIDFYTKPLTTGVANIDELTSLVVADHAEAMRLLNSTEVVDLNKEVLIPLLYGVYNGRGQYGNNFELSVSQGVHEVSGRPTFNTQIRDTRKGEVVLGTQQTVSLNNDMESGIPLFIEGRYKPDTAGDQFTIKAVDHITMNEIGHQLDRLAKSINYGVLPVYYTIDNKSVHNIEAETVLMKLEEAKGIFNKPKDNYFHALRYLNIANMSNLETLFNVSNIGRIRFSGGSDGILQYADTFDWNLDANDLKRKAGIPVEDDAKPDLIFAKMFKKAFTGEYTREVFSGYANPANYIVDMDFPILVKEAIVGFAQKRDEMQVIFNAPVTITTDTEAINFKQRFNYESRNFTYCPGNFEYIDPMTNRSTRAPMSFFVMQNILEHYQNGYDQPIAGTIHNGIIRGAVPNTQRGLGDCSSESNDKLIRSGYLVCKHYRNGQLFLNSQGSNYKIKERSVLQEFHNNSIINMILKTLYLELQDDLHRLTSADELSKVTSHINNVLAPFTAKVQELTYNCSFKNPFDMANGLVTHDLQIRFYNSMKYHHIAIEALGQA